MKKNKSIRQKKALLALAIVAVVAVGGTIAYHTTRGAFNNLFKLGYWQNETVEIFDSPTDWKTCEEIPKTVIAKNTGTVPVVVRLSYEEYWKAAGSTSTDHQTELPLLDGDSDPIAIVNLQNQADWEDGNDGYFYYKYVINPGQESNSMFKSVTLNCKNDFGGINDTCTVVGNTRSCTRSTNDQYEDATFHVFVKVQYLQSDKCNEVWGHCADDTQYHAKCDSNILYDTIACLSNGTDENIDFAELISGGQITGKGVDTVYSHKDDYYQTHYYRGDFLDNFVIFAGYCWRIVRTTSTGGVKMIYNGAPNGSQCRDITTDPMSLYAYIEVDGSQKFPFNSFAAGSASNYGDSYSLSPHMYGYMYSPVPRYVISNYPNDSIAAKTATWNGHEYVLDGTTVAHNGFAPSEEYKFMCPGGTATRCETVLFSYKIGYSVFELKNGQTYEDLVHDNTADSDSKRAVDAWYAAHMTSYTNKLEDTPFCGDRSFDFAAVMASNSWTFRYLAPHDRLYDHDHKYPTIDCADRRDAYSVSADNGNGDLTYPVALLSADEALLAGVNGSGSEHSYLFAENTGQATYNSWTMTPYEMSTNRIYQWTTYLFENISTGTGGFVNTGSLRPVISLKVGTRYTRGDGSRTNPFVIE